jgi:hypothetical protein
MTYLQSRLTDKLTSYDLDSLKSFESGVNSFKDERLPGRSSRSVLVEAISILNLVSHQIRRFSESGSKDVEQIKLEFKDLIRITAEKLMADSEVSKWISRSTNPKLVVFRDLCVLQEKNGAVSDAELIDITSSCSDVESWIKEVSSVLSELIKKHSHLNALIEAVHEDFDAFLSSINHFVVWHREAKEEVVASSSDKGFKRANFAGAMDLFMAYLQNSIDPETIEMVPQQLDIVKAGEVLVYQVTQLERQFIESLQSVRDYCDKYLVLLKTLKGLCDRKSLIAIINQAKQDLRIRKDRQSDLLEDAVGKAKSGRLTQARSIYEKLTADSYKFTLEYDRITNTSLECRRLIQRIESYVARCHEEYKKQDSKWQKIFAADLGDLQVNLSLANSYIKKSGWDTDGEAWKRVEALIRELEPICEYAEVSFNWQPLSFDTSSFQVACRKIVPIVAFINALCAIASCDGDFCVTEQRTVIAVVNRFAKNITEEQIVGVIRKWIHDSKKVGLGKYISQCVVDTANLRNTSFAGIAKQSFIAVLNADGQQDPQEIFVTKAMLARCL